MNDCAIEAWMEGSGMIDSDEMCNYSISQASNFLSTDCWNLLHDTHLYAAEV